MVLLTPIFFHLLSWFSEVAKMCKLTGVNNSLNGPERLSREKELSDSLPLIIQKGIFLFLDWCICSGQSSLSVHTTKSGFIRDHAIEENMNQSRGNGPSAKAKS